MKNEIKTDKKNYRKHNDRNKELINKSLKECGAGRSIVIDNENEIIAGNGIYEQAQKLGLKTKIIETDGSELVVVKRTDLATDDEKRKQLAVMDNSTSDSSEFDFELLQSEFDNETLNEWGIEADFTADDAESDNPYTMKVEIPIYEPKTSCPEIEQLYSSEKCNKLIEEIEQDNISDDIKAFLKLAAYRHLKFSYKDIAEFYCHQNKEVQDLMEKSALVIIDFDKAIENGYVKFVEEINELVGLEEDEV